MTRKASHLKTTWILALARSYGGLGQLQKEMWANYSMSFERTHFAPGNEPEVFTTNLWGHCDHVRSHCSHISAGGYWTVLSFDVRELSVIQHPCPARALIQALAPLRESPLRKHVMQVAF